MAASHDQSPNRQRRNTGQAPPRSDQTQQGGPEQDGGHAAAAEHRCLPWCPICRGAEAVEAGRGEDLRGQLSELQREAVLTARVVLDHYLERLERTPSEPVVEEIPIR